MTLRTFLAFFLAAIAAGALGCSSSGAAESPDATAPDADVDAGSPCDDCRLGDPCNVPESFFCTNCTWNDGGYFSLYSTCVDGRWCGFRFHDNPLPPQPAACPSTPPADMSSCAGDLAACGYSCDGGAIRCQPDGRFCGHPDPSCKLANPPPCPATPPALRTPCPDYVGSSCSYPCDAGPPLILTCDVTGGGWYLESLDACGLETDAAPRDAGRD